MEKVSTAEVSIAPEKEESEAKTNTSTEEPILPEINENACSLETTINIETIKDIIVQEAEKMEENVLEENIANLSIDKTNTDDEQVNMKLNLIIITFNEIKHGTCIFCSHQKRFLLQIRKL